MLGPWRSRERVQQGGQLVGLRERKHGGVLHLLGCGWRCLGEGARRLEPRLTLLSAYLWIKLLIKLLGYCRSSVSLALLFPIHFELLQL